MMFRLPFLCTLSEWQQKKQGVIPTTCFPNLTTTFFSNKFALMKRKY